MVEQLKIEKMLRIRHLLPSKNIIRQMDLQPKLNKMPVIIIEKLPNLIEIKQAYRFQKVAGFSLMAASIIVFIVSMILQNNLIDKSATNKVFNMVLILLLTFFIVREFYFLCIDRNYVLIKNGNSIKINNRSILIQDLNTISVIEYNGIGIMDNGFNIFLKLRNGKSIPISIRISLNDAEKVKIALTEFLKIEKFEEKKWLIG